MSKRIGLFISSNHIQNRMFAFRMSRDDVPANERSENHRPLSVSPLDDDVLDESLDRQTTVPTTLTSYPVS